MSKTSRDERGGKQVHRKTHKKKKRRTCKDPWRVRDTEEVLAGHAVPSTVAEDRDTWYWSKRPRSCCTRAARVPLSH